MRRLVLCCLWASHLAPTTAWWQVALGYLAAQVVLSYTMAGWANLANPDWRMGRALLDTTALHTAFGVALVFHLVNACVLGLNRFLPDRQLSLPAVVPTHLHRIPDGITRLDKCPRLG